MAAPTRELSVAEFKKFQDLIYDLAGIHYPDEKRNLLSNRIKRRLRDIGAHTYVGYLKAIKEGSNKQEVQAFLNEITTNETYFFRCTRHWDFFREWVGKQKKRTDQGRSLRIWSAAASNGAESYTIAIILREILGRTMSGFDIEIVGTDLNDSVLEEARLAKFKPYALSQTSDEIAKKYFKEFEPKVFQFDPKLASLVNFHTHNLMEPITGKKFNFIFLRNVMIYFDKPSKEKVLNHAYRALEPGGILVIGESESLLGIDHKYKYVVPSIFEKPTKTPTAKA